ncbi:MAG: cell wall hydrolase [Pseudobutyrivibrio sp.]|nr:cell wall hydrolase [Pseudobutyrivibrio sp.]
MSKYRENLSGLSANKKILNKRTVQGATLTLALSCLIVGAYITAPAEDKKAAAEVKGDSVATAGVTSAVADITVNVGGSDLIYASADVTVVAATTDQVEPNEDDQYDEWNDKVLADVNEFLYIHAEPDENSESIGKLRAGDIATLVEPFDGWYEIQSGNAHGYVSAEYCVTGKEAYILAMDVCNTYASAGVGGLRVRSEASEDAKILKVVPKGAKLTVNKDAEEVDGWVAVTTEGKSGYVKADYVQVDMVTGEAITFEEEAAAKAAAEEAAAKAKEEAAAAAAQDQAVIASADELTVMAAIIQIESGNEPYEGQVAVGAVIMNRVHSGAFPSSISDVVFARGQFATSRMSAVIAKGPKASCYQAARDALSGADPTGGLTHFRRAGSREGLIIGNQVFY